MTPDIRPKKTISHQITLLKLKILNVAFNGNEGAVITLAEASEMTERYRDQAGENPTLSHYVGKSLILEILNQNECVGLRVYYAKDDNDNNQLVFVGVDEFENDLYNGVLVDKTIICPPFCPRKNPLKSND